MLPIFDTILLHFSHSDSEVEIYVKGGTTNYVQESKIFIINMTSVTITTYDGTTSPAGLATIYSTDQSVEKISKKAAFHLMKDLSVDLNPIINKGEFSGFERSIIGNSGAAFEVTRTSITMDNIVARRVASSEQTGVFLYLIYLQTKTMRLTDMEFYLTGSLVTSVSPMNIYMENIYADTYKVMSGFRYIMLCNYPGANIAPTIIAKNFTVFTSNQDERVSNRPDYFFFMGSGNFTAENWDVSDVFQLLSEGSPNGKIVSSPVCNPDTDVTQFIRLDNIKSGLPSNHDLSKMNMLAIIYGNDFLIRKVEITASNLYVNDYMGISHSAFGFENLYTISLQNLHAQNYFSHSQIFYIGRQREIRIQNATFENVSPQPGSSISLQDFGSGYLEDITFRNYTGATQSSFPAFFIENSSHPLVLKNFIIENCEFYNQAFMQSFNPLEYITMSSITIMNTTLSPNSAIINVLAVKQIQADDISLSRVTANDPAGTDISFIKANSFNLDSVANSEVTNSLSVNSSMSFLTIESFIDATATLKLVKHQNITFRDTQVQSQSALVDMNRIISPQKVKFSFDNITFSNIKFVSSGYLIKFDHQLSTNVTMTN